MRIWGRVAFGGIAVLTSSFVITIPAEAAQSHSGVSDTCPEVLTGLPTGGVNKVTVPVDGSEVRRGDVVAVTLHWDTATFTSPVLHKALDCVTIDGAIADQLSSQERDTANDGSFETQFTVPDDLADGTRLCDRGFVSGPGDSSFGREKSNDVCFTVQGGTATAPAPAESSPTPQVPGPSATPAPSETPVAPAAPLETPDAAPGPEAGPGSSFATPVDSATPIPAPVGAGPAGQGKPGRTIGPDETVLGARDVLPRTGSAIEGLLRLAALALLLGGICLLVSPKERHARKHRSDRELRG